MALCRAAARKNATWKLAKALEALNSRRLPVRITPAAENMISALADGLGGAAGDTLRKLLDPAHTDDVLDEMGEQGRMFDAILHNTASPNILRGGDKFNVVPGHLEVDIDMRIVPGCDPQAALAELQALVGDWGEVVSLGAGETVGHLDMGMFDTLADILTQGTEAQVVPLLMSGGTDGRFFSRLQIQSYGYMPMDLRPDFDFFNTVHAADERIPVHALHFGADKIYAALGRLSRLADSQARPATSSAA